MMIGITFQKKFIQWKRITESDKIENVLIKRYIVHLTQAEGILFTTSIIIDLID